jgi:hypothetical protein
MSARGLQGGKRDSGTRAKGGGDIVRSCGFRWRSRRYCAGSSKCPACGPRTGSEEDQQVGEEQVGGDPVGVERVIEEQVSDEEVGQAERDEASLG